MVDLPNTNQFGREGGVELRADLLEKPPLLNNVTDRFHPYSLDFVDVLECVRRPGLFVLNHSDLAT